MRPDLIRRGYRIAITRRRLQLRAISAATGNWSECSAVRAFKRLVITVRPAVASLTNGVRAIQALTADMNQWLDDLRRHDGALLRRTRDRVGEGMKTCSVAWSDYTGRPAASGPDASSYLEL